MNPDDIPTSVTNLVYTAPWIGDSQYGLRLSQNDAATQLAHYWPAIAEHFARLIVEGNPDRSPEFSDGVDWAADTIRNEN